MLPESKLLKIQIIYLILEYLIPIPALPCDMAYRRKDNKEEGIHKERRKMMEMMFMSMVIVVNSLGMGLVSIYGLEMMQM